MNKYFKNLNKLKEKYNESMCTNNFCFENSWDDAIIGYTINERDEFTVIYDEVLIIKCIINTDSCSEEEAYDNYSYNLSYLMNGSTGTRPIIINKI